MSTLTKNNAFSQISIAAQIIDGSIKIKSVTEFENVLRLFPNDPALVRAYADLLVKKICSMMPSNLTARPPNFSSIPE